MASHELHSWWEQMENSKLWESGVFYGLCAAYSVVGGVAALQGGAGRYLDSFVRTIKQSYLEADHRAKSSDRRSQSMTLQLYAFIPTTSDFDGTTHAKINLGSGGSKQL